MSRDDERKAAGESGFTTRVASGQADELAEGGRAGDEGPSIGIAIAVWRRSRSVTPTQRRSASYGSRGTRRSAKHENTVRQRSGRRRGPSRLAQHGSARSRRLLH